MRTWSLPEPHCRKRDGDLLNRTLAEGIQHGVPRWLPKVDRTHMAHGLEYRSPFTDVDLIECALRIPGSMKIRHWREKHIFREAVGPLLPPDILNRPKFPQAMPYDSELSRVLADLADEILSPASVRARGFFSVEEVEHIRRKRSGRSYGREQMMRLWTLILTEIWARVFVEGRGRSVSTGEDPASSTSSAPPLVARHPSN